MEARTLINRGSDRGRRPALRPALLLSIASLAWASGAGAAGAQDAPAGTPEAQGEVAGTPEAAYEEAGADVDPPVPPAPEQGAEGLGAPSGGDGAPPPVVAPPVQEETVPPPPPPPSVTPPDDETYFEPDPVRRLDGWLRLNSERAHTGRIALAVLSLITAGAAAGGAVWAFSQDEDELRASVGGLFALLAVMEGGFGIVMLHLSFPQEDRYRRWSEARDRGATSEDVAGFAGELRYEAETQRFGRMIGAGLGLSMAAGGLAAVLLSATVDSDDTGRIITVAYGGGFLVLGALIGVLSLLVESPVEQDWNRYEQGFAPRPGASGLTLGLSPFVGDGVGGLQMDGRF